jgi:cobalt/nickel transport system permease protein
VSFHHLDQFAQVDSPVTRRAPVVRVAGTLAIATGAALLPTGAWPQMAALAAVVAGLAALARIPPVPFLARLGPPLAFVALASVAIAFMAPGEAVARVGPLVATDAGLARLGSVLGRSGVALGAAVVLVATTPFTELLAGLRALRIPALVTTTLGLAYRFLYLLTDEVERFRRAARSRNASAGSVLRRRLMVAVAAATLRRSFDRSERVHRAMLARGFDGTVHALRRGHYHGHPSLEITLLGAAVAGIVASALL